jgi:hypothetical protein
MFQFVPYLPFPSEPDRAQVIVLSKSETRCFFLNKSIVFTLAVVGRSKWLLSH